MTLTFQFDLDSVKMNLHARYIGQRSFRSKLLSQSRHTLDRLLNLDH